MKWFLATITTVFFLGTIGEEKTEHKKIYLVTFIATMIMTIFLFIN